ncbi:TetR/AcrR family transcriptional regulator [Deinococcus gobiensis]|uniref:Putative transcriptional regulator n=1 Tax=Deinococcus gobiensis (strain DSM 21396 / JCM 16679 / CGMCC 1.7299 / I-0) TaxID=745776 RepID=H8GXW5_DEIGI|nr:TetR/AcrR family transcriptional regulator [Deinococcus gobiensis]AFD24697.1 Putative transcriptional regulator [Deinococcus gobiensis I-0]
MTKGEQTRRHLLDVGRQQVLQKGYGGVGLKELLEAGGVPKGSFYHYFASKEAFGCALLDDYFEEYEARLDRLLAQEGNARTRLMRFWQAWLDTSAQGGLANHCLVVKLGAEIADLPGDLRRLTDQGAARLLGRVGAAVAEGQAEGSVPAGTPPGTLAQALYSMWLGAAVLSKVQKSPQPLQDALVVTAQLLTPTA